MVAAKKSSTAADTRPKLKKRSQVIVEPAVESMIPSSDILSGDGDGQASLPGLPSEPSTASSAVGPAKLTLTLTPDEQSIDWPRMRESTQVKARALLANSGIQVAASVTVTPDFAGSLVEALNPVMNWMGRRLGFVPLIAAGLEFSPPEVKVIQDPLAAVMNKYSLNFGKYKEEAELLFALGGIVYGKFSSAYQVQAEMAAKAAA